MPNIHETHGGMKTIKNGQRHRQMRYDAPLKFPVKQHLTGVGFGPFYLESTKSPHGHIAHREEGDHLPARLPTLQF